MDARAAHWDRVYATRLTTDVSWYQRDPKTSLRLIENVVTSPDATAVIDVGGGASLLVDRLLARSFRDLTVLDISARVLEAVRERLGDRASGVHLIAHDVLTWEPPRLYDVWHDRAVFHFLTEAGDRDRYVDVAQRALRQGGSLVLGTFAEDGPTECSGLPVARSSVSDLREAFPEFALVAQEREEHVTPAGVVQPFLWVVLRRA